MYEHVRGILHVPRPGVVAKVTGPICRTRDLYLQYSRDIGQASIVEADRGKSGFLVKRG
jgi:hypothetical protein